MLTEGMKEWMIDTIFPSPTTPNPHFAPVCLFHQVPGNMFPACMWRPTSLSLIQYRSRGWGEWWVEMVILPGVAEHQASLSCSEPHFSLTRWLILHCFKSNMWRYVEALLKFYTSVRRLETLREVNCYQQPDPFAVCNVFIKILNLLWPQTQSFPMGPNGNTILRGEEKSAEKSPDAFKQLKASFSLIPCLNLFLPYFVGTGTGRNAGLWLKAMSCASS